MTMSAHRGARVLGATRLSRFRDSTTSPERQEAAIESVAASIGGTVIGWARDMDVSASKTRAFDRPELGAWLQRPSEFDAVAWWRLDRAVRSMRDMADLAGWAKDHGKRLVFAEGPGGGRLELDMGSPISELILMILAFAAQMETEAVRERTAGASAYLRSVGRWSGGRVPFGTRPVPHPTELNREGGPAGWWLAEEPASADIIRTMADLVIAGKSYHAVAAWLNTEHPGVTPANHRAVLAGRPTNPDARWNPGMVSSLLRQQILRGFVLEDGQPVQNEDGEVVRHGDALLNDDVWHRLQAVMDSRMTSGPGRRSGAHPLLGVLFCGTCGGRLYQSWLSPGPNRKVPVRQYRCAAKAHGRTCAKPAYVVANPVDAYVEREFLAAAGNREIIEVVSIPAIDHSGEIAELEDEVRELAGQLCKLRGPAADAVGGMLQSRSDRLERLRAAPIVSARTKRIRTGVDHAEKWASAESADRHQMLLHAGVRVEVGQTTRGARDVEGRLSFTIGDLCPSVAEVSRSRRAGRS
ncbi:recombinase family protein [Actinomadura sp. BRA 177]|uniref:recombinase family protein n=1 Tax=Actinomadura sp. BRA 177 TaxID=2745202 RepID=UPI00159565CD|nr:recombinase family protein [Actinomadura sp. BRA 177]NVI88006.1 recombinase family protein [Actinomadura sp. BRA 177]